MTTIHFACKCRPFARLLAGAGAICFAAGCSDAEDTTSADPPTVELPASETTTTELGVASWSVRNEAADTFRILGRDGTQTRRVELLVHRDTEQPGDSVDVETIFPESGAARISRNGDIADVTSDYVRRLASTLHADLGAPNSSVDQRAASAPIAEANGTKLGEARFALSNPLEGFVFLNWNLFPYQGDVVVSESGCRGGNRHHFTVTPLNDAVCEVRWFSEITTDCRLMLHYENGGGRTAQCNWAVYTQD